MAAATTTALVLSVARAASGLSLRCSTSTSSAFRRSFGRPTASMIATTTTTTRHYSMPRFMSSSSSSSSNENPHESYAYDSDEEGEQHLAAAELAETINGSSSSTLTTAPTPVSTVSSMYTNKYLSVIQSTGLTSQLHTTTLNLPHRTISTNDVFCNREINLQNIRAIGFDMDYTLAQYNQLEFDKLAFDGAVQKLVHSLRYPQDVLEFTYSNANQFWIRGLIIDTQRGNFLKIDRHKYVRVAYHGFTPMSSKVRKSLYSRAFNKIPSFGEKHFVNLDTLFQHVDAHLFASLVDLKDGGEFEFLDGKTYEELFKDVRACVDLCHRDGTYVCMYVQFHVGGFWEMMRVCKLHFSFLSFWDCVSLVSSIPVLYVYSLTGVSVVHGLT